MPSSASLVAEINLLSAPALLLVLGAAGLYVASRAAVDAMARAGGGAPDGGGRLPSPGRLALGHWVPIVAVAWVATAAGQSQVALGVVFGSAVAALSLAMGLVTFLAPPVDLPPSRRAWPFVLAGAMIPLLAGFTSHLTAPHALMMLLLGSAVWSVWVGAAKEATVGEVLEMASSAGGEGLLDYARPLTRSGLAPQAPSLRDTPNVSRALQWVLAIALAIPAAKAAVLGTLEAGATSKLFQPALLAGAFLSPLLVLPMLASGTDLAHRGRSADAASSLVALALLNLFALLPAVILLWYVGSAAPGAGLWAKLMAVPTRGQPIPLPLGVWRIDAVVLTVLGFGVIPIALGRWRFSRLESAGLIVTYAAYLTATAWLVRP